MLRHHLLCASMVSTGLLTAPLAADTFELTGTLRDFKTSHPDFETYPNTSRLGIVEAQLGDDGKPVLNMSNYQGAVHSPETFAQWYRPVEGVNIEIPHTITLDNGRDEPGGVYSFARERPDYFFPIDNAGWGPSQGPLVWAEPGSHNYHFTYELATRFTYTDPDTRDESLTFEFTGDDDVWVYINGKLAVDLGGVHQQERGMIDLDTQTFRRYDHRGQLVTEKTIDLDLTPGQSYELKLFFAERHTSESNFRIETTLKLNEIVPLYD
ncbi:MAG: fibro-slime domain-containing protein [Phycisphaeraceae bacterium]